MKNLFLLLLAAAMVGCGVDKNKLFKSLDPADFESEISDAVKGYIAEVQYGSDLYYEMADLWNGADRYEKLIDLIDDSIIDKYNESVDVTFRDVFEYYAHRQGEMQCHAKAMLAKYDALRISLSDYVQTADRDDYKSWVFTEQRTGVKFLFEIDMRVDITSDGYYDYVWTVEPDEESCLNYFNRL
ncbi:MAG: hypothetical protein K2F95_08165 [Alistipes sp.]|nr:hypothetical protein [Alistipes sp.]